MLSAIVLACDSASPLARPEAVVASLAALVPALIAGLIGEASLATIAGEAAMHEIVDHAGCRLVEAEDMAQVLPAAIAAARGPQLLLLRAGSVPEQAFVEDLADLLRSGPAAGAVLRETPAHGLARLFPSLAPAAALVGEKASMQAAGRRSFDELVRALKPAHAFRCRAIRVGGQAVIARPYRGKK